jgi:predicted aspartyl protease
MGQLVAQSTDPKMVNLLEHRYTSNVPDVVTLPMTARDGLPVIPCLLDGGFSVNMILDTGSQGCVLEAKTAVAAHIQVLNPRQTNFKLMGIAGIESALLGLPESVSLGNWQIHHQPCLIRTHENEVRSGWPFVKSRAFDFNVWGMTPTRQACSWLTIDYPTKKAVFSFKGDFHPTQKGKVWSAPLLIRQGLPYVLVKSRGVTWTALVDTGSSSQAEVSETTVNKMGLCSTARIIKSTRIGVGTSSQSATNRYVWLPKIEKLGAPIINVNALVVNDQSKIGSGLLSAFRVTLDFKHGKLWLEDDR